LLTLPRIWRVFRPQGRMVMRGPARSPTITERLTGEKIVLTLHHPQAQAKDWRMVAVITAVVVVAALYFAAGWLKTALGLPDVYVALQSKQALVQERERLEQALGAAQRSYQIEVATRKELEETLLALTGQLKATQVELEFLKSKGGNAAQ